MILRGLIFFLICFTQLAFGQNRAAFASLDTNVLLIGDKATLHIGIDYNEKDRVISISPEMPLDTAIFEIANVGKWESGGRGRDWGTHRDISFTIWDTGLYRIPSIVFTIQHSNGAISNFQTAPLLLTVENPTGVDSMAAPMAIKDIVIEERTWLDFIPLIIGLIGLLALGFLLWVIYKKATSKQVAATIQQIIHPPHVIAERLLKELKLKQLWQKGLIKEYYSELSHILRGYIENAFKIPALESTTDELMDKIQVSYLREFKGQNALYDRLENLLKTADMVKFAKAIPPDNVHDDFWTDAFEFVEKTKPKPIEIVENQEVK